MSGIERTQHILQPFQASGASPDRRRKKSEGRPFEVDLDRDTTEETARREPSHHQVSVGKGDEGVGEFVNIVV